MESYRRIRDENVAALARWGFSDWDIDILLTASRRLHRLDEIACERELTIAEEGRERLTEERIAGVLTDYNIGREVLATRAEHQRDPRGWPLILKNNGGREVRVCPF